MLRVIKYVKELGVFSPKLDCQHHFSRPYKTTHTLNELIKQVFIFAHFPTIIRASIPASNKLAFIFGFFLGDVIRWLEFWHKLFIIIKLFPFKIRWECRQKENARAKILLQSFACRHPRICGKQIFKHQYTVSANSRHSDKRRTVCWY